MEEIKIYLVTGTIPRSKNSKFVKVLMTSDSEREIKSCYFDLFDVEVNELTDEFMEDLLLKKEEKDELRSMPVL